MAKRLLEIDFEKQTLCSDLSFTDIMDFKDKTKVLKYEDILCNMEMSKVTEQLIQESMIKPMIDMVMLKLHLAAKMQSTNLIRLKHLYILLFKFWSKFDRLNSVHLSLPWS